MIACRWAGAWKGMPSIPYAQRVPLHLGSYLCKQSDALWRKAWLRALMLLVPHLSGFSYALISWSLIAFWPCCLSYGHMESVWAWMSRNLWNALCYKAYAYRWIKLVKYQHSCWQSIYVRECEDMHFVLSAIIKTRVWKNCQKDIIHCSCIHAHTGTLMQPQS